VGPKNDTTNKGNMFVSIIFVVILDAHVN